MVPLASVFAPWLQVYLTWSAECKKLNGFLRVFIIKYCLPKRPYSDHLFKYVRREVCSCIKNLCGPNMADFACLLQWKSFLLMLVSVLTNHITVFSFLNCIKLFKCGFCILSNAYIDFFFFFFARYIFYWLDCYNPGIVKEYKEAFKLPNEKGSILIKYFREIALDFGVLLYHTFGKS